MSVTFNKSVMLFYRLWVCLL